MTFRGFKVAGLAGCGLIALAIGVAFETASDAQSQATSSARPLITAPINDGSLVLLLGNTRPEANVTNDRGIVADDLPMEHMMLQLKRSPEQEQAIEGLIERLHDPASPDFHKWLTADEIGAQYGLAASDLQKITGWLQQHGFTVNTVFPSGMLIDFSGTAGQVHAAFQTEIHNLLVNGVPHVANISDPQIPAALAPAVVGIVTLNNFRPAPQKVPRTQYTVGDNFNYLVTPADLATIYNFNPLFSAGITGAGQAIYLVEDSDYYSANDWTNFRSTLGLAGYTSASLTTVHPGNCTDPLVVSGVDEEVILDTEWASAAAPNAAIIVASCKDTNTTYGFFIAIANLINGANPPAIVSMSYGDSETNVGVTANAAIASAYQQAVAEGMSIYVSSGDQLAAVSDRGQPYAQHGINANAYSTTPYNVAVGGTDFGDYYIHASSTYWNSTNSATGGSAKSYVLEIPWNSSCASTLIAQFVSGSPTTYGSSGFCNTNSNFTTVAGGSGGPSACAAGSPSIAGVVSGSCVGYAKPSWQTGVIGIPNDGVRDTPDVSLFAASGVWGHAYVYCFSDSSNGGKGCSGALSTWNSAGGTSFSSPIFAGIQALVNQQTGSRQGNPNTVFYKRAATEYGSSGSTSCNSSLGNAVSSSCIFYDVTQGDIDAPCRGSYNCYLPSGTNGVLSTSNGAYAPAYKTTTGWDFATGLGTVNAYNLVMNWTGGSFNAAAHDFNGDGKSDILWRATTGDNAVWLMNGGAVSSAASLGNIDASWSVAGQRDFDGDGKSDILWHHPSGAVAMWLMNGGTVKSAASLGTVDPSWSIAGTGDFNGDGKGDVLWHHTSGNVAIWLMNGTTVTSNLTVATVDTSWSIVGSSGKNVVWRNTSGDVALWTLNGATVTLNVTVGNVPTNWSVAGVGDFNGDGNIDILWHEAGGSVAIWFLNAGGQVTSAASVGSIPANWSIVETGDFNGDGKSDILWRASTGDVAVWLMNGGTVAAAASLGSIPTIWSVQGAAAD